MTEARPASPNMMAAAAPTFAGIETYRYNRCPLR
nr:MAG TPA: hypothetical protein [Caudoviricetes sp.]